MSRKHIQAFIAAHPTIRVVGCLHDRDPGTECHGHIFFFDPVTKRTEAAVHRMFAVPGDR